MNIERAELARDFISEHQNDLLHFQPDNELEKRYLFNSLDKKILSEFEEKWPNLIVGK